VYFRVSDVFRNVNIAVKNGDEIILKKKRPKVAPGEMESIKISKEMLADVQELAFELIEN